MASSRTIDLLKLVISLLPVAIKTAIFNALSLSENSAKQSTKVETVVTVIRTVLSHKTPLSRIQARSSTDRGIKGPIWIAKVSLPPPRESDGLDAVLAAIRNLGNGSETFAAPCYATTTGEWTGWRYNVAKTARRPDMAEAEQYRSLIAETTSPVTILYFHGGGFFCLDPASHRHITALLAKRTAGRVFSLRYRLAPQHPFPSALIDCLLAYLYLLAPPPSALHTPIPAAHIVFAGDSAGGNLALSLNLLILTLKRMGIHSLRYHGVSVPLERPAGVATNSPWTEITCSLPSQSRNAKYDYLPGPPSAANNYEPTLPNTRACEIWPSSPPRAEIYCSASLLTHPLVCPLLVPPRLWEGTPSVFLCVGEETLMDGVLVTARHILASGSVPVVLAAYEGMPHCGALVFPGSDFGRDCIARWAAYCTDAVEDSIQSGSNGSDVVVVGDEEKKAMSSSGKKVKTVGTWMKALARPAVIRDLPVASASDLSDEQVSAILHRAVERASQREQRALDEWRSSNSSNKDDRSTARARL
ncbi:hypothetical protein DV737_g4516, partial [Chaetothyriales sp. CBS 132003]